MGEEKVSFADWLRDSLPIEENGSYRHRRIDEVSELRAKILPRLKQAVFEAHEDARRRLRDIEGVSLDPLEIPSGQDPAEGYPERLSPTTLMGYFGEFLAGIVCEEFAPFGEDRWKVPAYLFRYHLDEFRHLDRLDQVGPADDKEKEKRFGRAGDDCLAFVLDENGNIARSLVCEAKCVQKHTTRNGKNGEVSDEVADAHVKLGDQVAVPLDRQQLIEILREQDTQEAARWVNALRKLRYKDQRLPGYERCDLVCCIYGTMRHKGKTWIPRKRPHPSYQGKRRLEATEVYIRQVHKLVQEVYGKESDGS